MYPLQGSTSSTSFFLVRLIVAQDQSFRGDRTLLQYLPVPFSPPRRFLFQPRITAVLGDLSPTLFHIPSCLHGFFVLIGVLFPTPNYWDVDVITQVRFPAIINKDWLVSFFPFSSSKGGSENTPCVSQIDRDPPLPLRS